jgi:hypothetical protein
MTPIRDVYYGTGAYLARVDGETQCAFWPTDPLSLGRRFDPGKLVAVDLSMTAEAAAAGTIQWDQVQTETGKLTFGPRWPLGPNVVGRVYLREDYVSQQNVPCPPLGSSGENYEFMLVIYRKGTGDPRATGRYQGAKVEIIGPGAGGTDVWLYGPGVSKTGQRKRITIDLGGLDVCPPPKGIVQATPTVPGALFVRDTVSMASWPSWPKLPPVAGF